MNAARDSPLAAFFFLRRTFEPATCCSVFTTKLMNPFWYDVNAPAEAATLPETGSSGRSRGYKHDRRCWKPPKRERPDPLEPLATLRQACRQAHESEP